MLLICFYFYTCLSDIYLFLPPMIGFLFILYMQASRENRWIFTFAIVLCLIFSEFDHDKTAGVLPIVFVVTNWLVIKKFRLLFEDNLLFVFVYVPLIYFAYFFTLYLLNIFGGNEDSLDLSSIFISYIFYEACLGIAYEKIKHQI
ncbi:hypothetical protein [Helicobacter sp. 11S02596-1]|uniref:hypothetical protein n=1 Tax=Helicobacter sp. 11S02596-1 TaxID=1476194 RepID=UPI000BA5C332|nr:hypothetical protein [Helicobacter sp. 11S02596-1]PAF42796.1 hypothetical protein BJI48_05925 [Helicobacter sp. 11S02596-1]